MYYSSTTGNMNVLVDYSKSDTIKIKDAKSPTKFKVGELEILLSGNQLLPKDGDFYCCNWMIGGLQQAKDGVWLGPDLRHTDVPIICRLHRTRE